MQQVSLPVDLRFQSVLHPVHGILPGREPLHNIRLVLQDIRDLLPHIGAEGDPFIFQKLAEGHDKGVILGKTLFVHQKRQLFREPVRPLPDIGNLFSVQSIQRVMLSQQLEGQFFSALLLNERRYLSFFRIGAKIHTLFLPFSFRLIAFSSLQTDARCPPVRSSDTTRTWRQ